MAPPSKLSISTSALLRLIKEEASYHKELEQQEARIKKLESSPGDDNSEYQLKQERQAVEETKNVLPAVQTKITQALKNLEELLEGGAEESVEVTKAKEAIAEGKRALSKAV